MAWQAGRTRWVAGCLHTPHTCLPLPAHLLCLLLPLPSLPSLPAPPSTSPACLPTSACLLFLPACACLPCHPPPATPPSCLLHHTFLSVPTHAFLRLPNIGGENPARLPRLLLPTRLARRCLIFRDCAASRQGWRAWRVPYYFTTTYYLSLRACYALARRHAALRFLYLCTRTRCLPSPLCSPLPSHATPPLRTTAAFLPPALLPRHTLFPCLLISGACTFPFVGGSVLRARFLPCLPATTLLPPLRAGQAFGRRKNRRTRRDGQGGGEPGGGTGTSLLHFPTFHSPFPIQIIH